MAEFEIDPDPDMDIEETTLIYPRIQSIYTDLSDIKSEPVDYQEDDYESVGNVENENYYKPFPNKIILGTKPRQTPEPVAGTSAASDSWSQELHQQVIECTDCSMVFPTQNELDSHKMASHSFLVARPMAKVNIEFGTPNVEPRGIRRQKAVKSTAKSSLCVFQETKTVLSGEGSSQSSFVNPVTVAKSKDLDKSDRLLCKHCDVRFPNEIALIKHTYELIPSNKYECNLCNQQFDSEVRRNGHRASHFRDYKKKQSPNVSQPLKEPASGFKCEICSKTFATTSGLNGHRSHHFKASLADKSQSINTSSNDLSSLRALESDDENSDSETYLQCTYCTIYLRHSGHCKRHMLMNHETAANTLNIKKVRFNEKCTYCGCNYKTQKRYNSHILRSHPKQYFAQGGSQTVAASKNMKCTLCNKVFTGKHAAYKHKLQAHPLHEKKHTFIRVDKVNPKPQTNQNLKSDQQLYESLQTSYAKRSYIPKNTMFKCNKCPIHFVTCSTAMEHSKRCTLAKGDWKCNKCRRTFIHTERHSHTLQHDFSDKFKVHVINEKILRKVLCRCPKCDLHFDEMAFWKHVTDCTPEAGEDCYICNLKIHSDSYTKHKTYHNKYNLSRSDYIMVEFVDSSFTEVKKKSEEPTGEFKRLIVYCIYCKAHTFQKNLSQRFHMKGKCTRTLTKKHCEWCGLTFCLKPWKRHVRVDHETENLTLADFKFVRMQDDKVINPILPEFYHCKKCNVRFNKRTEKISHVCFEQMYEYCSQCSRKYAPDCFKVHLAFHEYPGRVVQGGRVTSAPLETKPSKTLPLLIFFGCISCRYGFHSYDSLVEHCQNHYTDSESLEATPCKMCKLSYAEDHSNAHIVRSTLRILKFDYEKLQSDSWSDSFKLIPKTEAADILSRSVYGVIRNVRLVLSSIGPADRSLFRCSQCQLNIDEGSVAEHTKKPCPASGRYKCESCDAQFPTKTVRALHARTHTVFGDDIMFREIVFNQEHDRALNDALQNDRKESLKFRKCQRCQSLIKASEYQEHMDSHEMTTEVVSGRAGDCMFKLFKPSGPRKMYTVYQCRDCNATIIQRSNVYRHRTCVPPTKKCPQCLLWIHAHMVTRHQKVHAKFPKFLPRNITVFKFEKISKKAAVKRRRYSSDDDASVSLKTAPVTKTYATRKARNSNAIPVQSEDSKDDENDPNQMERNIKSLAILDNDPSQDSSGDFDQELGTELMRDFKYRLYQCQLCYLLFMYRYSLVEHLVKCDGSGESPVRCERCELTYHHSMTAIHVKLHETGGRDQHFFITTVLTSGRDVENFEKWLYKCKVCDLTYANTRSIENHFINNHSTIRSTRVKCSLCHLTFPQRSITSHQWVHHAKLKCSVEDLHLEIVERKTANGGDHHLPAAEDFGDVSKFSSATEAKCIELRSDTSYGSYAKEEEDLSDTEAVTNASFSAPKRSKRHIAVVFEDDPSFEATEDHDWHMSLEISKDIKNKLYQCEKCYKLFLYKYSIVKHRLECNGDEESEPLTCDGCDLTIHPSMITVHENLHRLVCMVPGENHFFVSTLSTRTLDFDKSLKWLYKCQMCDLNYNSVNAVEYHILKNHAHKKCGVVKCTVCGLNFTERTIDSHVIRHSKLKKCSAEDFHFELIERKIAKLGEFRLSVAKNPPGNDVAIQPIQPSGNVAVKQQVDSAEESESDGDEDETNVSTIHKESVTVKVKNIKVLYEDDPSQELTNRSDQVLNFEIKRFMKNKLYQCERCYMCFVYAHKLFEHRDKCDGNTQEQPLTCNRCALTFHSSMVTIHEKIHELFHETASKKRYFYIATLETSGTDVENPNDWLFKCKQCDLNYLSPRALEHHINKNHYNRKAGLVICVCGLIFTQVSHSAHQSLHHDTGKCNAKDLHFEIIEKKFVKAGEISLTEFAKDETKELIEKEKLMNSSDNLASLEGGKKQTDKIIYKCTKCCVHFLNINTLLTHIQAENHVLSKHLSACDICGLRFGKVTLNEHKKYHHEELNLSLNDLPVVDLAGNPIPIEDRLLQSDQNSVRNAPSTVTKTEDRIVKASTVDTAKEKPTDKIRLYQCKDCKVCVEKAQRILHVCCSDIQKKHCLKCCLVFRSTDLIQHRRLHRKHIGLSRKNFVLIRFGRRSSRGHRIYKCSCSTHFVSLAALEWHLDERDHRTKKLKCSQCGLFFGKNSLNRHIYVHHTMLKLTTEQFNILYVSTKTRNDETSTKEISSNLKLVKKLFKCAECDVCFLNRGSYYQHIYRHRKLDATEYIDCNMCDLQFLNEALGVHMKSHRDGSFVLDELMIEEFRQDSDPAVENYFVKNGVNSKLVSTTTPFEDESLLGDDVDQLSVIDSTSDVPTAKDVNPTEDQTNISNAETERVTQEVIEPVTNDIACVEKLI